MKYFKLHRFLHPYVWQEMRMFDDFRRYLYFGEHREMKLFDNFSGSSFYLGGITVIIIGIIIFTLNGITF